MLMFFLRLFIIMYLLCVNVLHSQPVYNYQLTVKSSSIDLGKLYLGEAYYLTQYKGTLFKDDSASHIGGMYNFDNKILYPTAVRVFNFNGFNQLIFIDTGFNEAEIVITNSTPQLKVNSKIELEHGFFLEQMGVEKIGEQIPMQKFQAYVLQFPKSYIALFALIDQMFNYRFAPEMWSIADKFDPSIKSTKAFSHFKEQYLDRKKFVAMNVVNEKGKTVSLPITSGKYTLLDFWWVGCKPCYVDMQKMNQKISGLGERLNIISINTDGREKFKESKVRFANQHLSWKSYWDYDGVMSQKNIFFYKYPTNLLIDKDGYIVATDIDIERLEDFIRD
jgi:thiol-disulfide isomerase/thioredoxin